MTVRHASLGSRLMGLIFIVLACAFLLDQFGGWSVRPAVVWAAGLVAVGLAIALSAFDHGPDPAV